MLADGGPRGAARGGAGTVPCEEADEALKLALAGIFCFGFILEPLALQKALEARRRMAADRRLAGSGKVAATFVIAPVVLLVWLVVTVAGFAAP